MPITRYWTANGISFRAPYFVELFTENGGFLPREYPAHALWHYYCVAMTAYDKQENQPVYEGDTSPDFNAEQVFKGIAMAHGVNPDEMIPYWNVVETQALMLGGEKTALPPKYKFNRKVGM